MIEVASGQTATIAGSLSGSSGFRKSGGGTLAVTGRTLFSGTVEVAAGRLVLSGSVSLETAPLAVGSGGSVVLPDDPLYELRVASLSVAEGAAGGRLDVGAGRVTVAAGGIDQAALLADLRAGRGDGRWDGVAGIGSRTVAAAVGAGLPRSVGWIQNADASFTVGFAAPGDTNIDGVFDILDAAKLLSAGRFGRGGQVSWAEGDFNYDGLFDILDVSESLAAGLYDTGAYAAGITPTFAAVPEPSTAALVLLAGSLVLGQGVRRWRRSEREAGEGQE